MSQYEAAPLLINPSNTGNFNEDWRVNLNYREQWTSLGTPFKTYGLSADKPFYLKDHKIGAGFILLNDNATIQQFKTFQFLASFSYQYFHRDNMFRIGIQPGIWHQGYDPNGITLPEQYNMYSGLYDPTYTISEDELLTKGTNFDLNIGASWSRLIKDMKATAGFSINHINVPKVAFATQTRSLPMRWLIHADVIVKPLSWITVQPSIIMMKQQKADELILGCLSTIKKPWTMQELNSLAFGVYFRSALFENFDAVILSAGIHYSDMQLFISYDINVSGLQEATNLNGAFEIGLIYKRIRFNKRDYIPPCISF